MTRYWEAELAEKQKANGSAGASDALTVTSSAADELRQASGMSIRPAKAWLEARIDVARITDPQWLADPENRRIALVLLKAAQVQRDWAVALLNTQVKVDEKQLSAEEELASQRRAEALAQLAAEIRKRSGTEVARADETPWSRPQKKEQR
jgi:hypothetical protein